MSSSAAPSQGPGAHDRGAGRRNHRAGRGIAGLPGGRRTKYVVVVLWLAVIAVGGGLAGKLTGAEKNDSSAWLPAKAESTQALNLQSRFTSPNVLPAVVVYQRASGLTAADLAKARADARSLAGVPHVGGHVTGPLPSRDGTAVQTIVSADLGKNGWNGAGTFVGNVRAIADRSAGGLNVYVTGPAGSAADSASAFTGIDSTLLYATLAVIIVLLLFTYRSPLLWLLPIVSAGVALASAEAVIYLLAAHAGLTVNAQSSGILTVLVLGAGTDYALLLIARYREELRRHADRHEAMAVALRRAGPAIIASAATVAVGMLCLLVAESNSTRGLGPVAAIGIGVGLLAMVTLLPALLVIFGRWMFWPLRPRYGSAEPTTRGLWARTGRSIARHPRAVWTLTAVVLGGATLGGLAGLKLHPLTNKESFTTAQSSVTGEDVLSRHFPAGAGEPVTVLARTTSPATAAQLRTALGGTPGIASTTAPVTKDGVTYLEGTLTSAPDSPAAYTTVDRARAAVHAVPGVGAKVGGGTAVNLDMERAAAHDRNLIIPVVLVVVLLILALLLRAVVAPLVLIATVVLSFGAALGLSSLVFTHLFHFAAADASFPLYVFVFLVALGIDYNIFLMTRVREESMRNGTRQGALAGLAATGGVITSAGAVLAGTFGMLGTLPMVMFAEIGFAVALGVLLDTIVVRSVLVTALTLDIGRWMWWPSRLSRRRDTAPAVSSLPDQASGEVAVPVP